jgi:excinuclease ABC subunit A
LAADYIIDLGPEGGEEGGRVVVAGAPSEVLQCFSSHTGAMLRELAEAGGGEARERAS